MQPHLLIVEDDETLGYALCAYLEMKNFKTTWAKNGKEGIRHFRKTPFDLCLLDIMMPKIDGFQVVQQMRMEAPEVPVIFLTAKSMKVDKLKAFDMGADDYIVKPVDEEELVARIHAVLRRSRHTEPEPLGTIQIGDYTFDAANQQLTLGEEVRQLTARENKLLQLLCEYKGRLLPRGKVLKTLWNQSDYFTRRSMDVFISRLRKYLSSDERIQITNVYGSGFILSDEGKQESAQA